VLVVSSFSLTEVTGEKQLDYNFWSDVQILNAADKNTEREREREREREEEEEEEEKEEEEEE